MQFSELDEKARAFLERNHAAAMITLRRDGTSHTARVAIAVEGGKIRSSSNESRLRTKNVRRDPRATLFVFDTTDLANAAQWLALECRVSIIEGPTVPDETLRLFRVMQDRPDTVVWAGEEKDNDTFRQMMVDDHLILYEFDVLRAYGTY